jgi:uncharacterized protein (TIGR03086 family)
MSSNDSDADRLDSVLSKTVALVAAVAPDQRAQPTPCPKMPVGLMVDHIVGWARGFAAQAVGEQPDGDPNDYRAGDDPAGELRRAGAQLVQATRTPPADGSGVPVGVLLMEEIAHGWDLATATGQAVPFSADEAEAALAAGRVMLKPEYRGPGKTFGDEVEPPDDATAVERLVAFLGRDPRWTPAG